jgi:HEAT repeat protein
MRTICTVGLLVVTLCAASSDGGQMNAELMQLMAKKDWRAVEVARTAGPQAVAELEPYLQHRDPAIRALAVDCLNAAGGARVSDLLIQALRDTNEQVRINAIKALHERPPQGREQALLAALDADRSRDGFVRQQIPMILGRMGARGAIPDLRRRLEAEPRQDVKDGFIAGLAKMGDPPAREEFGALLRDARGERTAELMEYVRYLDEPWVIPLLVPVLERREIAVDLSTHRTTLRRRECDLAVDEVLRISKAPFSFALNEIAQYTEAQIAEVLQYARAQRK